MSTFPEDLGRVFLIHRKIYELKASAGARVRLVLKKDWRTMQYGSIILLYMFKIRMI